MHWTSPNIEGEIGFYPMNESFHHQYFTQLSEHGFYYSLDKLCNSIVSIYTYVRTYTKTQIDIFSSFFFFFFLNVCVEYVWKSKL